MKKQLLPFLFSLLILFLFACPVLAEGSQTLFLPRDLKQIKEQAFCGNVSLDKVVIPEGTTHIGSRAFADSSVREVVLPHSLEYIAPDAFSCCEGLTAYAVEGSYAQEYCEKAGITCLSSALPASDFSYEFIDDGTACKITGYLGTAEDVVIPETIDGMPVTTLGRQLFYKNENIRSVCVPDSVALFEDNVLSHCVNLQRIVLPRELKKIPSFYGCRNLSDIVWPESYTDFESFYDCRQLKSFKIPEGMTEIPSSAFRYCSSLTEIEIPESVTRLEDGVFSGCSALTKVTLPGGLTDIGGMAFENCTSLTYIAIPEGVDGIGLDAFKNCPLLTVQVVGNSYAEGYCRRREINYLAVGTANLDHLFETVKREDGSCEITKFTGHYEYLNIPASIRGQKVSAIGYEAFANNHYLREIVIPEGVTEIGNRAFYQSILIESVHFPSTLQSIGDYAFASVYYLEEAILPRGATDLGTSIFSGCHALTKAVLPADLTEISDWMFGSCNKLESINIPAGVTRIGNNAFKGCTMLQSPILPEGLQEIGANAFNGCDAITELVFPQNLTKIGRYAYSYCKNLYLAIIPATVQEIGDCAFLESNALTVITERNCAALEYCKDDQVFFIIEPNAESDFKTTKISSTACRITGYTGTDVDVFLPETIGGLTVEEVYTGAFMNNTKIESISILNSAKKIGSKAFMNCTSLRYAAVSDSVTSIADNAFDGCTNLESIYIITLENG